MELATADLKILGRIASASNATLLCELGDTGERAVYKPVRGEVPLWDFPDGTLAGREVASYRVSDSLGWGLIPETVLRDGPLGPGMVQRWIEEPGTGDPDGDEGPETDLVDLFPLDAVPDGYLPVFTGYVEDPAAPDGMREVALAHADDPRLRRMAVLDVLINNADRKGGHILTGPDGRLYGVDHGICLHVQPKLRTVLWGWAGKLVPDDVLGDVEALIAAPPDLDGLISEAEQLELLDRARILVELGAMPLPTSSRPIPWPPF